MKNRIIASALICLLAGTVVMANEDGKKDKDKDRNAIETISISGRITDRQSGEGLAGVVIRVEESDIAVYTDFEGNFSISATPGSYTIKTSLISYETRTIIINADKTKEDITIQLDNIGKK
ncbi:MAG: carboxypeptidase-like regulatory domain-containing protein [Bacteroidales bacterium]|jgi:hypothetical protein|nr:carboxypeptidase-like regulatory domain-containing protein [Bacteroidales bacterium]